jgi:HEAT repeat protein
MAKKRQITKKAVVAALNADNYAEAKELGDAALPHLQKIVEEGNALLAAKATYLAGLLDVEGSFRVIETASKSRKPALRAAAAAAAGKLTAKTPVPVLKRLLRSRTAAVRRWALRSTGMQHRDALRPELISIKNRDESSGLRKAATHILKYT